MSDLQDVIEHCNNTMDELRAEYLAGAVTFDAYTGAADALSEVAAYCWGRLSIREENN